MTSLHFEQIHDTAAAAPAPAGLLAAGRFHFHYTKADKERTVHSQAPQPEFRAWPF
jgi:hypothetical protein